MVRTSSFGYFYAMHGREPFKTSCKSVPPPLPEQRVYSTEFTDSLRARIGITSAYSYERVIDTSESRYFYIHMEDSQATPTSGFDFLLINQDAPGMNPNEDSSFQAGEHQIVETFYPHELNITLTVDSTDRINFALHTMLSQLVKNNF